MNLNDFNVEENELGYVSTNWFIDLNWYRQNGRSLVAMARDYLCAECKEKLADKKVDTPELFSTLKDCCAKSPDYIAGTMPVSESIFRLFLSNGNHPLILEEISRRLSVLREGDAYRTSPEVLFRLLENDNFYGFGMLKR